MIHRALLVTALLLGLITTAPAQELRDSWHALPEQTAFVIRMPQPSETVDHLREKTKFGKVVLDGARWTQLIELIKTDPNGDWDEMEKELAKVGLTPDDLIDSWRDPWGMGLVVEPRADGKPLVMMLAWIEAGEEKAEKYMDAIARGIEQQEDAENPVQRVDMELAGHEVMHLKSPQITYEFDYGGAWDDDGPAMQEDFIHPNQMGAEEAEAGGEEIKATAKHVDQTNSFITRIGGRVVAGITIPTNEGAYDKAIAADPDAKIDYDELSGLKAATGVFARFLEAHEDEDYDFAEKILATRGLQPVMPSGQTVVELYGDFRPVMKLLKAMPDAAEPVKWLDLLGVSDLQTMAMKVVIDGNVMRSGLFVAAPAPRRGMLALLDQPVQAPKPASWAPAHAVEYTHISFDLGAAYQMIRQMIIDEMGEEAEQVFKQMDVSVQSVAQADLQTVLAGLGDRHTIVGFESRLADDITETKPGDMTRAAFVWKLRDEAVWQRLVMALAMLQATPLGQQMEMVEEQGFTGWRLKMPEMEQSVMIGKGYLTWAIGNEVTAEILNVLRSEPEGKAALANSELVAERNRVFDPKPGIAYRVVDGNRTMRQLVAVLSAAFTSAETSRGMERTPEQTARLERFKQIMPTKDELEGVLGVGGSHVYMTDDGLVSQDVLVLPE